MPDQFDAQDNLGPLDNLDAQDLGPFDNLSPQDYGAAQNPQMPGNPGSLDNLSQQELGPLAPGPLDAPAAATHYGPTNNPYQSSYQSASNSVPDGRKHDARLAYLAMSCWLIPLIGMVFTMGINQILPVLGALGGIALSCKR